MSKNLISKASIYSARFANGDMDSLMLDLALALEAMAYEPPQGTTPTSYGFVSIQDDGRMVTPFAGGFAIAVRVGDKVVPGATVKAEVKKRIEHIEQEQGRKPGRKERKEITAETREMLTMRAFTKESQVTLFYNQEGKFLIANSTSSRLCDIAMTALVRAAETLKTSTIHISVSSGLTARLRDLLLQQNDYAFGMFEPTNRVTLKTHDKRTLVIKSESIRSNNDALVEALKHGYEVKSLGLTDSTTSFVLDDKFKFTSIESLAQVEGEVEDSAWEATVFMEVNGLVAVARNLCEMLGYVEPTEDADAV